MMSKRFYLLLVFGIFCNAGFAQNSVEKELLEKLGGRWWKEVRRCGLVRDTCWEAETFYKVNDNGHTYASPKTDVARFSFTYERFAFIENPITEKVELRYMSCSPWIAPLGKLNDGRFLLRFGGEPGYWLMILHFPDNDHAVFEGVDLQGSDGYEQIFWEASSAPLGYKE